METEMKHRDTYIVSKRVKNKIYFGESTLSYEEAQKNLNEDIMTGGSYALFDMDEAESIHNSGKRTRV